MHYTHVYYWVSSWWANRIGLASLRYPVVARTKIYIIVINKQITQQHTKNYKTFIDEFTILLSCFDKINSEIIITGDLNIDLLKINHRPIFSEFYMIF